VTAGCDDCDCSWTDGGSNCGGDDGSHCWACCCGSSPTPGPPSPAPAGTKEYCPDPQTDFNEEIESDADGNVQWSDNGWTITGQRRVSTKASFDFSGGGASWDFDLSGAHGNVNNNFYLTYPYEENTGISHYCDSGGNHDSQGRGCAELDWTENNGGCHQATTWHDPEDGSDLGGYGGEGNINAQISAQVSYSGDGSSVDITIGGNHYNGNGQTNVMKAKGAVIYSSQWQGWVPGDCGYGDLYDSKYTVKNIKITGRVVQGPEPRLCNPPPIPVPTPVPSPVPTPTPPVPTPAPSGVCPGGSLSACIGMCPSDAAVFPICVKVCTEKCSGADTSCTGVDDGADLASCVRNCPSDSAEFQTCVSCCSNKHPSEANGLESCFATCPAEEFPPCVEQCTTEFSHSLAI